MKKETLESYRYIMKACNGIVNANIKDIDKVREYESMVRLELSYVQKSIRRFLIGKYCAALVEGGFMSSVSCIQFSMKPSKRYKL